MSAAHEVSSPGRLEHHDVVVVGAGFAGIGASIKLGEAGIEDHVLIEEADDVGGTWHWNTYPGVGVDIPAFSYQFSFAASSDWSRLYAPGAECLGYAHRLADEHGLRERTRFGVRVVSATWQEAELRWCLALSDDTELTCTHLIGATGALTEPRWPEIPGLADFAGPVVHTARWDHDLDLTGLRVGVVGTGASAVQLIPSLAGRVAHLTVFQRTPIWCLPKPDIALSRRFRSLLRHVPGAALLARAASQSFVEATFTVPAHYDKWLPVGRLGELVARAHLRRSVRDPATRAQLTPAYALGCKLPAFSNTYLAAFERDDVSLQTGGITEVTASGVRVADDSAREVVVELDVLVLATGFRVFERGTMPTFTVSGADGLDLETWWSQHRLQAYEGISVPGFPSFFLVLGPYGYNGASYFALIESQVRHIVRALVEARRRSSPRIEVRRGAHDHFMATMWSRAGQQVFRHPTCASANSYYVDSHGDVPLRAATTVESAWRSARYDLDDYEFSRPAS